MKMGDFCEESVYRTTLEVSDTFRVSDTSRVSHTFRVSHTSKKEVPHQGTSRVSIPYNASSFSISLSNP